MTRLVFESPWLRHPRIWIVIGVIGWFCIVAMWLTARDVPTIISNAHTYPETLAIGQPGRIVATARRDLSRNCSIEISRSIIDADKVEHKTLPFAFKSAEGIRELERENPGKLIVSITPPRGAAIGPAIARTENRYTCPYNPSTWFVPISDVWTAPLVIAAAASSP